MWRRSSREVDERLGAAGYIVAFNEPDAGSAIAFAETLCRGGARAIEFTNRSIDAVETFKLLSAAVRDREPDCVVGFGSVVDAGVAAAAIGAGADFVVSPALLPEVARVCHRNGVLHIPGCATLTEMLAANELGCGLVKMFPATSAGGARFLRDVLGPCPWLRIIPSGGIDVAAIGGWFDAGAYAVTVGSSAFGRSTSSDTPAAVLTSAQELTACVKELRW